MTGRIEHDEIELATAPDLALGPLIVRPSFREMVHADGLHAGHRRRAMVAEGRDLMVDRWLADVCSPHRQ